MNDDQLAYALIKFSERCKCKRPKAHGRSACDTCLKKTKLRNKLNKKLGKKYAAPVWINESRNAAHKTHLPVFHVHARTEAGRSKRVEFAYHSRRTRIEAFTAALSFAWTCWIFLKGRFPEEGEIKLHQKECLSYCKPTQSATTTWYRP